MNWKKSKEKSINSSEKSINWKDLQKHFQSIMRIYTNQSSIIKKKENIK